MARTRMHADEVPIDETLVRDLLAAQFPAWADLELAVVEPWGTDNAIWRLGNDLVLRFPRKDWAQGQPAKEDRWLPVMADHLTVAVPEPVGLGAATDTYPFPWSIHRWLEGQGASPESIDDHLRFADDMAAVIHEMGQVPSTDGPPAHNRARPLEAYDAATRRAIDSASSLVDVDAATAIWEDGLAAATYDGPARWVHGDLEGNCLVVDGRLSGLIDWGSACIGDPAVDVQVAWSPLFTDDARARLLDVLDADDATVARAKAAAINQACAALPYYLDTYPLIVERSIHKLQALGVAVHI